jgi:hypothetical protein
VLVGYNIPFTAFDVMVYIGGIPTKLAPSFYTILNAK